MGEGIVASGAIFGCCIICDELVWEDEDFEITISAVFHTACYQSDRALKYKNYELLAENTKLRAENTRLREENERLKNPQLSLF